MALNISWFAPIADAGEQNSITPMKNIYVGVAIPIIFIELFRIALGVDISILLI